MSIDKLEQRLVEIEMDLCESSKGLVYKSIIDMVERPVIEYALQRSDGNQLMAARILGINRNTIRSKIKKLGIDVEKCKPE